MRRLLLTSLLATQLAALSASPVAAFGRPGPRHGPRWLRAPLRRRVPGPWRSRRTRRPNSTQVVGIGAAPASGQAVTVPASDDGAVVSDLSFGPDELQRLDVYPASGERRPVVIFVHGGGWTSGDKEMLREVDGFRRYFQDQDAVLVAPNHRLMFDVTFREQAADVAGAVAWVAENIHEYGGDPERILLWGFSSGAHLVALVGTDPRYLGAHGLGPGDLAGVCSFDVVAYDVPRAIETAAQLGYPRSAENLVRYFTADPATQRDASPVHHLGEVAELPPFLVVSAALQPGAGGEEVSQELSPDQSRRFVEALSAQGASATWEAFDGSHSELVVELGTPGHEPTTWLGQFLEATTR